VAIELKILILKPSSLGDVIHTIPVLRLLKSSLPKSQIYWWLDIGLVPLLEKDPDLDGIIPFPRKRWRSLTYLPEMARSVRSMREQHFDWAIDLQGLARSALFGWLSDSGILYGLDNPREGAREGARGFYDLFAPRAPEGTHAVDRYLSILPLLKIPIHHDFCWIPPRPDVAEKLHQKWPTGDYTWIMLMPGARWDNKRWPAESFAAVVKQLSKYLHLRFAILGGKEDQPLGQIIARDNPGRCLDLTGQTSLPEMVEWIRLSSLAITNDTGPMHVAAALNKPVVAIFGPTDPRSTGPYGQPQNVLQQTGLGCVPCLKSVCRCSDPLSCLRSITPSMVCEKTREILKLA